ncbi:MAG: DUF6600 domain-containing protein [Pseudomonadota bacterium]
MASSYLRALLSFLLFALLSSAALADPPTRVARLAYVSGNASFSPGGERDWGRAIVNRPLTTGDRLWIDSASRAELQMGTVAVRAGGDTSLTLLNLDDRTTQIQLSQGTLNVRVRRLDPGEIVEIDTPNLAYSIRRAGSYRIDVNPRDDSTTVAVRQGTAQVFGDRRAFVVNTGESFTFYGEGLDDYEAVALRAPGEFDRWVAERDRRWDNSPSRRYVSREMIGYEDLDNFGTWQTVPQIGPVWLPTRVDAEWAPYRDGHWSWVEPWGWTWIDEAPWGFAPSHYGRWMRLNNQWAWVPGPADMRPVYAPAQVAFVGYGSADPAHSTVAWFPLGPGEVYRPAYATSREYFYNVNASNAHVDRQAVTSYFDNRSPNVTYVNQQVPGAIVAVLVAAFSQSQPVARQTVRITEQSVRRAPVMFAPPVVPQQVSVVGPAAAAAVRPPEAAPKRPVVAQIAPPSPPPSFAARQGALASNAGKPLEPAAVAAIKPTAPASTDAVRVVPQTQAVPVPKMPDRGPSAARERRAQPQRGGDSPAATAPAAPAPAATAPVAPAPAAPTAAAPAPAAAPADAGPGAAGRQRASEARGERGRGPDRAPATPAATPPAPDRAAATPPAPPPAARPAPAPAPANPTASPRTAPAEGAAPSTSRSAKSEQRGRRAQPAASAASAAADAANEPRRGGERGRGPASRGD